MIDTHSHILYGVDDGSKTIDNSIEIIRELVNLGFTKLILTPHFIDDTYNSLKSENQIKLKELQDKCSELKIKIDLYLGNEIFVNNKVLAMVKDGMVSTINDSKYILLELPFYHKIAGLEDFLYELQYNGLVPIIVHPERYTYFQDDYKLLDKLYEEGIRFQVNYSSIIGHYGSKAQKLMKYMLKNDKVLLLGTDIHTTNSIVCKNFIKIRKKIVKLISEEKLEAINNNALKIILNREVDEENENS